MRMQKRRAQNIGKKGKILMVKIKDFKKVDKIEELGDKICKFVGYYERKKGWSPEFAALAEILIRIKRIFKSHDEQFKKLEKHNLEYHGINENDGINNIKIVLDDPNKKEEIV